ncbi:MAG: ABC transporter ATP-binding protein [Anaerolineales bacterium]|nr:ABC transporter ATP-binding protein [Anaerolineales bacterium]
MAKRTIIETHALTKIYGMGDISVHALDGVDLKIEQGEFVAIMGPSGSGKSTLMHILGCLSKPTSGSYILDGESVGELDKVDLAIIRNKKIGFIFQSYNLLPRTTALRNVILPLMYDRDSELDIYEMEDKAYEMLELVGLADRVDHQPQELSGGQQQRVAVARALINDPVLIIADEPTGNLDSKSGEEIMNVLHTLHQRGATIVMVTHDPQTASHTERTIHLLDGKVDEIHTNGRNKADQTEKEMFNESV